MRPRTHFASAGGIQIAYQTFGQGPDLVVAPGWVSNVEQIWELPEAAKFYEELSKSFRVTLFDKRGTGLSDRNVGMPTLEGRMDDLRAVMDDAGIEEAIVYGVSEGGSLATIFTATYPERVRALALFGTFACREKKPDYPWAPSPEEREIFYDAVRSGWSEDMDLSNTAPSLAADPERMGRLARYSRSSATPSGALELAKLNTSIDVRHVLPLIRVATVVMRRLGDRDVRREEATYISSKIPGSKLLEFPGEDHIPTVGDTAPILQALRDLAGVEAPAQESRRLLATVVFTDIVGSTGRLREAGDAQWSQALSAHNELIRSLVKQYRGVLVKFTGDGALSYFDGPSRAAQYGLALAAQANDQGLEVRAAVHTCEVEVTDDDILGIGVHLAARAMTVAQPREVVATGTVKALVSGSGLCFQEAGEHLFKGFEEPVPVYRVS